MAARIGVLTGGGDCPGLNAAIRAVVRAADQQNIRVLGFPNGWEGVLEGEQSTLTVEWTRGLLHRGGTVLGTSRVNPYREENGIARIKETMEVNRLDGLVVIGGEGTLSAAHALHRDEGIPLVGIPKTIDNDVSGTDHTIGFMTAVEVATDAVDRLHTTAESHHRIMVLEVMGRHAGWIATFAGMAGGADAILIPEVPFDIEAVSKHLRHRHASGRDFSIVVVAEGAKPVEGTLELAEHPTDEFGRPRLGGIGYTIAHEIEERTEIPTRVTVLGHVQRGGSPVPFDRSLATRFGVKAVTLAHQGKWGTMTALRGAKVAPVPLADATEELNTVPPSLFAVAERFFG